MDVVDYGGRMAVGFGVGRMRSSCTTLFFCVYSPHGGATILSEFAKPSFLGTRGAYLNALTSELGSIPLTLHAKVCCLSLRMS